jgi:DNA repair protein RecO (recombination protein O)
LNLRGAEWAGSTAVLRGEALFSGFYLNELLMKLLARHDAHATLFDAYAVTLPVLAGGDELAAQAALRAFELTLLREIGLLPDLGLATSTQRPIEPAALYALRPEGGVVAAARGGEPLLTGADLLRLRDGLAAHGLAALQAACAVCLPALRGQLRTLLHYHLGTPLLRSREAMLDVQRLLESARR